MKLEECEAKIDAAAIACNLAEKTVIETKRSIGIRARVKSSFSGISDLPTDTVLEIGKKENKPVLGKVIPLIQKELNNGKRPSAKKVKGIGRI